MTDFIDEAIAKAKVELQYSHLQEKLYNCALTSVHGTMVRDITMKSGFGSPTVSNVVYYYAMIAQQVSQYGDVLQWADDEGHDLNDPETLDEFKQMVSDEKDLRLLLSEPLHQEMMAALEISQALSNATPD